MVAKNKSANGTAAIIESPATPTIDPIWPTTWAITTPEDQGALSPLPSIWVISKSGRGKSSFIASIPGKKLVFDNEESWSALQYQTPDLTRIDLRAIADQRYGADSDDFEGNIQYRLFLAFVDEIAKIKTGQYDVIAVDPYSDLYFGSFFWVADHAEVFGKTKQRYSGTMGTQSQWADATLWWENWLSSMGAVCQTVVLTSHPKEVFDKQSNAKTDKVAPRGADITNKVSLKIWLFDERDDGPDGRNGKKCRWAMIEKSRLSWHVRKEGSRFPRIKDLLPKKLIPTEAGMTFPEMIWNYMDKPLEDYGDLDKVAGDPTASIDQAALAAREAQARQDATEDSLKLAKREMVTRLVASGLYRDGSDIASAIVTLELGDDVQHESHLAAVETKLMKHRAPTE